MPTFERSRAICGLDEATLESLLVAAAQRLHDISATPVLDAQVLLRDVVRGRAPSAQNSTGVLSTGERDAFEALIERRSCGEPVAYIRGEREFWSLSFFVTRATLIPRPDTETLVERALMHIPTTDVLDVADLGTGCGAIALALATERPHCRIAATDRSPDALAVAARNIQRHNLENVALREGDWLHALPDSSYDVIVSNPPYVAADDPHLNAPEVRYEPRDALLGGADGLDALRQIIETARTHLRQNGYLLVEHGYDQGGDARALFSAHGYTRVASYRDLAGNERVTEALWPYRNRAK